MDYTESTTEPSALVSLWKEDLWLDALLYSAATGGLLMALDKETEMIPTDSKERKDAPVFSGFMAYFPDAIVEVARLSRAGNDKHNPGQPLHWSRDKSDDHADCIARHQLEFDKKDKDGFYHAVMVAWRAMAQLQLLLEQDDKGPVIRFVPGEWPKGWDDPRNCLGNIKWDGTE